MGGFAAIEIPLLSTILYLFGKTRIGHFMSFLLALSGRTRCVCDSRQRQCQAGSLTGAVHLSNRNVGVLRLAQKGRKPFVEQKGKSPLDLDFQY